MMKTLQKGFCKFSKLCATLKVKEPKEFTCFLSYWKFISGYSLMMLGDCFSVFPDEGESSDASLEKLVLMDHHFKICDQITWKSNSRRLMMGKFEIKNSRFVWLFALNHSKLYLIHMNKFCPIHVKGQSSMPNEDTCSFIVGILPALSADHLLMCSTEGAKKVRIIYHTS